MIGITFLPKQDVLLGVNVDVLNYENNGKKVEATRLSFGIIFITLSILFTNK